MVAALLLRFLTFYNVILSNDSSKLSFTNVLQNFLRRKLGGAVDSALSLCKNKP